MKTLLQISKMVLVTLFFSAFFSSTLRAQNSVYTVNSTDSLLCNGAAYLDSSMWNSPITWMNGNTILASNTFSLTNLCIGSYTVTYTDANGNPVTETFTIHNGTPDPCAGFYINVVSQNPSNPGFCDGSASVTAIGGTAPYSYLWNTGEVTSSLNQLCSANYFCTVQDANGCSSSASIYVTDSIAPSDSLYIFNDPLPGDTINGDLGTATTEDCTLDLSNVYTAGITDSYLDSGMVYIVWTLNDWNNQPIVSYTLPYPMDTTFYGLFQATLEVYCHGKSTNPYDLTVVDHVLVSAASVEENTLENVVFNNPVNEKLSIQLPEAGAYDAVLVDLSGKMAAHEKVNNDNRLNINTSNLGTGVYVLKINGKNGWFTTKIIK